MDARVDWFRVLADLRRSHAEMTLATVARALGLKERTIRSYYAEGHEPNHRDGEAIVGLWCSVLRRQRSTLPRLADEGMSAAKAAR